MEVLLGGDPNGLEYFPIHRCKKPTMSYLTGLLQSCHEEFEDHRNVPVGPENCIRL